MHSKSHDRKVCFIGSSSGCRDVRILAGLVVIGYLIGNHYQVKYIGRPVPVNVVRGCSECLSHQDEIQEIHNPIRIPVYAVLWL